MNMKTFLIIALVILTIISSVIRQKDEFQNGDNEKANETKLLGGKKCSFFGKFGLLCFLLTSVLRFALLPYDRRFLCSDKGMDE